MAKATYDAQGPAAKPKFRLQRWTDQHGRKWLSTVDLKDPSASPASPLEPCGATVNAKPWKAPLVPPAKYLSENRAEYGTLLIDYDRWLADERQYQADWSASADMYARGMAQGDDSLYARLIANPTPALLRELGPRPVGEKYVLACMAGDPWALGLSATVPAWAVREGVDQIGGAPQSRGPMAHDFSFLTEGDAEAHATIQQEVKRGPGRPRKQPEVGDG